MKNKTTKARIITLFINYIFITDKTMWKEMKKEEQREIKQNSCDNKHNNVQKFAFRKVM